MEKTTFKAYITKYCLTEGIQEMEAEVTDNDPNTIIVRPKGSFISMIFFHKNEWFRTKEEAKVNSEKRVQNKINSLKKQIAKLEKLEF